MKKTGTTIFTLALALILVSTLSSGVILADDDDDKKKRYKTVKVRDVAMVDCLAVPDGTIIVFAFDFFATEGGDVPAIVPFTDKCTFALASLQSAGFRAQSDYYLGGSFDPKSRHTLVRTRKVRVEK